ncbi:uncharacterized protein FOMMEDRAFT_119392 [Fomitiporia mediterranea MF3/22]|uniref:uncharacterized protein n=1 Tax=Fomitiporia mediterranea (strain MF3/22) TaxID=694068 RepID=UPI0004409447|nr:uncharacterized protein FOMMEDRAFT_119392 [Fomitiporia mediterranea MF3/22]EJD05963.1 hypothetical protein FOMMEDRAFT_119392 [Fomitiporia mediterranea MF3/22]
MPDLFTTDNLTVALGLVAAGAFLLHSFLTPQSLVHPILLGRQSDVDRVRQKGESAVYRNYGTGLMSSLPARPAGAIATVLDFIKSDFTGSRSLWSTNITNEKLKARITALGAGLVRIVGLQPKESNVLLLLNDSLDFLVADLALASQSIPSLTISSLTLLSAVLDAQPPSAIILHVHSFSHLLEQIAENREYAHHTFILVGEGDLPDVVEKLHVKIFWLADLEKKGANEAPVESPQIQPQDIYSVSFYPGPNHELKATRLTHQNMTAGVTATRALFPLSGAISESDSIASSHSLSTPFGRAVAYTALYENAHFSTIDTSTVFSRSGTSTQETEALKQLIKMSPALTITFLTPPQLNTIVSSILSLAEKSLFFSVAWRHKLSHLQHGFLSKENMWDNSFFVGPRKAILKGMANSLRAVVISGDVVNAKSLTPARLVLSVPVVNTHQHPLVAGPVFFSHPLDFQDFPAKSVTGNPEFAGIAHVGPPSINVEAKLAGVDDAAIESGVDPIGEIVVRGPSVTLPLEEDREIAPRSWVPLGEKGMAQSNGSFKVIPARKHRVL